MVLPEHIEELTKQREGLTLELKSCTDKVSLNVYESICALLNREGGEIIIGANDKGEILGINRKCVDSNPLIAKVFREMKWVEELGSGKKNIKKYAPLYYDDYQIEIENKDKFVFTITYRNPDENQTGTELGQSRQQVGSKSAASRQQVGTKSGLSQDKVKVIENKDNKIKLGLSRQQVGSKSAASRQQVGTKSGLSQDKVKVIENKDNKIKLGLSQDEVGSKSGLSQHKVEINENQHNKIGLGLSRQQVGTKSGLSQHKVSDKSDLEEKKTILRLCITAKTSNEILSETNLKHKSKFVKKYIRPLIEESLLAMSVPDKPNSRLQKYYTTENGILLIE